MTTRRDRPLRASSQDRDADFAAWMGSRQGRLLRTAYLLTGDRREAEDLVQTALAKLYLAWDRLEDRGHLDAYARQTLVNEHRSSWRRAWRRREVVTEHPPEVPTETTPYDGQGDVLWAVVQGLPPRQRAVIVLRYYEELSERETAQALGISVGTVKSQASRALAAMRPLVRATSQEDKG